MSQPGLILIFLAAFNLNIVSFTKLEAADFQYRIYGTVLSARYSMMGSLNIEFTIQVWREGNHFIAHAMPLDVMSFGNTPDEAKKALDEAVLLFVQTASDMGTLEDILEECGYQCDKGTCVGPAWIAIERHTSMIGLS